MYAELVAWCRDHMLRPELNLAHPADLALPQCVEDGAGVLRIVREHHSILGRSPEAERLRRRDSPTGSASSRPARRHHAAPVPP